MTIEIDPKTGSPIKKDTSILNEMTTPNKSLPPTVTEVKKPSDEAIHHEMPSMMGADVKPSDEPVISGPSKVIGPTTPPIGPTTPSKDNPTGIPKNPFQKEIDKNNAAKTESKGEDRKFGASVPNNEPNRGGPDSTPNVTRAIGEVVEDENSHLTLIELLEKIRGVLRRYTSDSQSYLKAYDEVEAIIKRSVSS